MKTLELDFMRAPAPPGWAGWLLLAVALAFTADLAARYQSLLTEIDAKRAQLARALPRSAAPGVLPVASQIGDPEEFAFARDTIRRLALPWDSLFSALEFAQSDRVALLSIEPDAEGGTVTITAEARDYLAALSYVGALAAHNSLARVHLAKHETKPNDPQRQLVFTVSTAWSVR